MAPDTPAVVISFVHDIARAHYRDVAWHGAIDAERKGIGSPPS